MVKLLEAGPRFELPLNNRPDKGFYAGGGGLSFHCAESEISHCNPSESGAEAV